MVRQAGQFTLERLLNTIKLFGQATVSLRTDFQPQLPLELALVEATLPAGAVSNPATAMLQTPAIKPTTSAGKTAKITRREAQEPLSEATTVQSAETPAVRATKEKPESATAESHEVTLQRVQDDWAAILAATKARSRNLEAILKDCQAIAVEADVITLSARSPFHKEKLEDHRSKELLQEIVVTVLGQPCRVKCILSREDGEQASATPGKAQALDDDPVLKAALELGAEIADVG